MEKRGTPASSPSSFSRCSIAHFQKDSWYVCEGGYCSRRLLRRREDSRKSCTWRNGRWEGNDKNRGCFRAEYACKRLNKAGSEDGITLMVLLDIADAYQTCPQQITCTNGPISRSVSRATAKTHDSCSVTVTSYVNAQGLKSCCPFPLLHV